MRISILRAFVLMMILKNHLSVGFPPNGFPEADVEARTKSHHEITHLGIWFAAGRYILDNNFIATHDKSDKADAVNELFGNDTDGLAKFVENENDIINNVKVQHKSKEAHIHCNAEQIELAHNHVIKLRKQIKTLADSTVPDFSLLRKLIGKCMYTIQAFYSGTNWVEMNGNSAYKDFGVPNRVLMAVTGKSLDTCMNCDNTGTDKSSCRNNLLVTDMLTSGYQTDQDAPVPYKTNDNFNQGKCGYGGITDTNNGNRTAQGGINKDRRNSKYSPHHYLHNQAFFAARQATELFLVDQDIGIINNELNLDIFAKIFGLVKRHQASFGFVIDDTGSMANNIEEVRKACITKVNDDLGGQNAPSNYILVTFNDPEEHNHRLTTTNGLEMISALGNITVDGGDDCPEYSMSGLEKAIDLCQNQSTIFLFTDAPAKDKWKNKTVSDAAIAKHVNVQMFLQNDMCDDLRKKRATGRTKRDVASDVYSLVAENAGGTVHRFDTTELKDMMTNIMEELFPSANAIVDMLDLKESDDNSISFPVDSMLNNIKITVIGATTADDVDVESPFGSILKADTTIVYFEIPDKVVVTVPNPISGIYKLLRTGNSYWSVNITAQSSVDFHYLITEQAEDGYLYRISGKPIVGERYTLYFHVYNLPAGMEAKTVRLTTSSLSFNYLSLTQIAEGFGTTYFASTTLSSSDLYEISIHGTESDGNTWMRKSPYLISSTTVRLKVISMPDLYVNTIGQVTYTLENKGSDNETFVIDVIDDRGLLTGQTTFNELINSNGFSEITFQLQGSSLFNTVTFTITVGKHGSVSTLLEESQTLFISQDIPPTCSVQPLVEICNDLGNTSCSAVTWNGQATITFDTELSSILGLQGELVFETSSLHFSPIRINVSGDCCTPLADITVIDKNSNFARCRFYLGHIEYVVKSELVLSTTEQIAIGVIVGVVAGCLFASLIIGIVVYRKAIKPTLDDSKIKPFNVKNNPFSKEHLSEDRFNNVFDDSKCHVSNKPPIATTFQQPLDLEDLDLE